MKKKAPHPLSMRAFSESSESLHMRSRFKRQSPQEDSFTLTSFTNASSRLRFGSKAKESLRTTYSFMSSRRLLDAIRNGKAQWPASALVSERGKVIECAVKKEDKDDLEELLERYGCNWQQEID